MFEYVKMFGEWVKDFFVTLFFLTVVVTAFFLGAAAHEHVEKATDHFRPMVADYLTPWESEPPPNIQAGDTLQATTVAGSP